MTLAASLQTVWWNDAEEMSGLMDKYQLFWAKATRNPPWRKHYDEGMETDRPTLHRGEFANRRDAGRRLAEALRRYQDQQPVVLALPRGGVPVGAEIAKALKAPLDVLIVRKLGAPGYAELATGARRPHRPEKGRRAECRQHIDHKNENCANACPDMPGCCCVHATTGIS